MILKKPSGVFTSDLSGPLAHWLANESMKAPRSVADGWMPEGGAAALAAPASTILKGDASAKGHEGFDLLRVPGVRRLTLWGGLPYVFQASMLAVFIALAVISWGIYAPEGVDAKLLARTNLAALLISVVWWPAMVWIAVLLGRAWCTGCPRELLSNLTTLCLCLVPAAGC